MSLTVKKIGEFINSFDLSSEVLSVTNDGVNSLLTVENVYHIRALSAPYERYVDIDGTDYKVLSVNYDANTVTVEGVILSATKYTVPNPIYYHGTLISTSNEIKNLEPVDKYPMIYLNEIITERLQQDTDSIDRVARVRLGFLDYYSNDWNRSDHYDIAITALSNLAEFVRTKLYKRTCLNAEGEITQRAVPKWGKINIPTGNSEKWFNDYIDAIEWELDLSICKC